MDPSVRTPITSVEFLPYTKDEIEAFSVMPVSNPNTFDHSGKPTTDGVYDIHLGPTEHDQPCPICGQHQ